VPAGLTVLADPDQLFRVLFNLAQNAVEAIGTQPGTVRIAAELGPEQLTIDLADTGPGIPEQVRARLFQPFAGSSKAEGNGLGLAICRELMRAHGGEIELVGTGAQGTVFRLRLPARLGARVGRSRRSRMPLETVSRLGLALFLLAAGCDYKGPAVAGYPGLQNQIQWFYGNNALEQNATCTQPRMRSVTRAQIVNETQDTVVMNIGYAWLDEGQLDFDRGGFVPGTGAFFQRCNGFAERQFTFTKMTDGSLQVRSMTGPQRRPSS